MHRFGLRFLSPEGESGGGTAGGSNGGTEGNQGAASGNQNSGGEGNSGKTFTQEEVSAISAREKSQGKNSILKMFGCTDEASAKAEAEEYKKWKQTQLTPEQKAAEEQKKLQDSAAESEKRAQAAEAKLSAINAGVDKDSLEDALAIAMPKVTAEKDLDKVLAEMKKESRYAGFFTKNGSSNGGTGSSANHNSGGQGGTPNIGERLAKEKAARTTEKSKFFSN